MKKKQALFRGTITELDVGEFFADIAVKFRNLEIRMVIPRGTVDEWGLKLGDKVYVLVENKNAYIFKR